MSGAASGGRPDYDRYQPMDESRGPLAEAFAAQILATCQPWLPKPAGELDVLDIGCGYGHTAAALAERCRSVVGLEPAAELALLAAERLAALARPELAVRHESVYDLDDEARFDLVVLDNVYEHLREQDEALARIARALRPGGVLFLLTPNRLWPVEVHYRLPFLSYLPLEAANRYLRWSGRGTDYTDASYAPTLRSLGRALARRPELSWRLVLPADPSATAAGSPWHYRLGMRLLRRWPALWAVSKAFLVVAVKER